MAAETKRGEASHSNMAADQAGQNPNGASAQAVSREKILHALASLMANKDAAYVAGVRNRAAKGNLQIKGQSITEEIVDEALTRLPLSSRVGNL